MLDEATIGAHVVYHKDGGVSQRVGHGGVNLECR
jgi:hypothetical protein